VWLLAHYSPVSAVNGESVSRDVLFRWNGRSFQTAYDTNLVPATFGTGAFSKISFANNTLTAAGGRLRRFGEAARPAGALVARWDGVNWDFEQPPSGRNPITQLEPAGGVQWAVQGGTLTTSSTYSTQSSRVLVLSGNAWTQLGKLPRGLQLIELAVGASGTPYLAGETRGQTRFDLLNWKEHRWHEVALGHAESLRSERRHPLDAPRAVTLTDGSVVALLGQRVGTADKRLYLWSGCS
jgi:hypothetical protein